MAATASPSYAKQHQIKPIDPTHLDRSVLPTENFYRFANGGWLEANPIPPEYSRWGSFEQLNELSLEQQRVILEECVANFDNDDCATPSRRAVAILYATGMDETSCEAYGLSPLADVFSAIDDVRTASDAVRLLARLRVDMGIAAGMFRFSSVPDAKNSAWEVVSLSQTGSLGIGDRDFYFLEDKMDIREKYVQHVENMLRLGEFCPGDEGVQAQLLMQLETNLAESCMSKVDMRDPDRVYNKFEGVDALIEGTSPNGTIPWRDFFKLVGLPDKALSTIIVDNPHFFMGLSSLLEETPVSVWQTYLRYHVMRDMAEFVGPEVKKEHFWFYGTVMTGQPEMKPRWKRVLKSGVTDMVEDSLGILYTEKHFTREAKQACVRMVEQLVEEWKRSIEGVAWMQTETKTKALGKLEKFRAMIGYPERWDVEDVPDLLGEISMDKSFVTNVRACQIRNYRKVVARIDKAVDMGRWEMPSTIVNAYFHPLKNVIVFPAAILQPPFFYHPTKEQPFGDVAINFSAIGGVICHEISHGYDDKGRKFDAKGELVDWWTESDAAEYERRASNMVKLCDEYEIFGKNLNGKLCLGENIADYGGVKVAYRGLESFQEKHGRLESVDGFTPEQRFFLGWAILWRNNIREENALQRIIMDPHAPGEFRANIVQVIEEFHDAFGVKEGDPMWKGAEERCDIW